LGLITPRVNANLELTANLNFYVSTSSESTYLARPEDVQKRPSHGREDPSRSRSKFVEPEV